MNAERRKVVKIQEGSTGATAVYECDSWWVDGPVIHLDRPELVERAYPDRIATAGTPVRLARLRPDLIPPFGVVALGPGWFAWEQLPETAVPPGRSTFVVPNGDPGRVFGVEFRGRDVTGTPVMATFMSSLTDGEAARLMTVERIDVLISGVHVGKMDMVVR